MSSVTKSAVSNLSPEEKRKLLTRLLEERIKGTCVTWPLSYGQQALWFVQQLAPESVAYNVSYAWSVCSKLDVPTLRQAFQKLVDRHSSLRTIYKTRGGRPVQQVCQHQPVHFSVVDADKWSLEQLDARLFEEAHCHFDLERGPVLRASLFMRSMQSPVLLLVVHHIAVDGWSLTLLLNELGKLYTAISHGVETSLPSTKLQYTDYVHWQTTILAGSEGKRLWDYWQRQLAGDLPELELFVGRPRSPIQTYCGASQAFVLRPELVCKLKTLAKAEGTTLYVILLAALYTLFHIYTGQKDIIIGGPTSGRSRSEFMDVVGYFVNMVALRADLSGNPEFRTFLRRVRHMVLETLDHQDYPFVLLVDRLQLERDASRSPLFQIVFTLQSPHQLSLERSFGAQKGVSPFGMLAPGETEVYIDLGELVLQPFPLERRIARFDIELEMVEADEMLSGWLQYNTDLFETKYIARMIEHFQHLLESVATDPGQRLSDVSVLDGVERHRLLAEWNDNVSIYPWRQSVNELFEAQVVRTPDAVALVAGEQQLTYYKLNWQANQLARYLSKIGVGPGKLVGICLERSLEIVIAILGVLKAGGVYVPLDPAYPPESLSFMLDDAGISIVLTQDYLTVCLPEDGISVACLNLDWTEIAQESGGDLETRVASENSAYVMYTSGSTGKPKGIAIPHRAISRLVINTNYIDLGSFDRVAQVSNSSFDAATFEIWGALLSGGSLVIIDKQAALSAQEFTKQIREQGITALFLTTALFNQVVSEVPSAFSTVQSVLFGGQAVDPKWVRMVLEDGPPKRLLHVYGPTESTTYTSWYLVEKVSKSAVTVPIGKPLANTQIYVLDEYFKPVPIGVPGELYIGGDGLAHGYVNRPGLTAEHFVPNPFSSEPGARLYKTGDLVRYLSEGDIEFIGRLDHQVKIRGFRVELGEVEVVLSQHPAVQETVALALDDSCGNKRLVAYVVPNPQWQGIEGKKQQWCDTQVDLWKEFYNDLYGGPISHSPTFNIVGWNSSYTGEAIPAEAMEEQVNQTVERILTLEPDRVLEVGCGTGLLLFRLAPSCTQYLGTDFSPVALQYIQRQLSTSEYRMPQVSLLQRMANDFEGIGTKTFEAVVLNSVVQYFPSVEYLLDVLERSVNAVKDGGFVFVGDVRNFSLLRAFHASVCLSQSHPGLSIVELQRCVQKAMESEEELTIDPNFFFALRQRFPRINGVQVQLKRGRCRNELTLFRYDVLLHIGKSSPAMGYELLDWQEQELTLPDMRRILVEGGHEVLGITRVPNARLLNEVKIAETLFNSPESEMVDYLRVALQESPEMAVDPEDLWDLGRELSYDVDIGYSKKGGNAYCDVLFKRRISDQEQRTRSLIFLGDVDLSSDLNEYVNNPLRGKLARTLMLRLRDFLKEKLPDYMVPSAFVVLDNLPLTPNGKVDRRALPKPTVGVTRETLIEARNPVEERLVEIWCEVLEIEHVGVYDNFFELGGHSLLATQVVSRVRSAFQVELPLQVIFETPTVVGLAQAIASVSEVGHVAPAIAFEAFEEGSV
jgi:amino acid adenylation domain-containing protein